MKSLEVGTVYHQPHNHNLFLAVSPQVLVGYVRGKKREITRDCKWAIYRDCSVGELIESWKISLDTLDKLTTYYLPMQKSGNRQHNKGGREDNDQLAFIFRQLRMQRLHNKSP